MTSSLSEEVTDGDCIKERKTMKKSVLTELDKAVLNFGLFSNVVKVSEYA